MISNCKKAKNGKLWYGQKKNTIQNNNNKNNNNDNNNNYRNNTNSNRINTNYNKNNKNINNNNNNNAYKDGGVILVNFGESFGGLGAVMGGLQSS